MYIGYTDLRGEVTYIEGYDTASRRCGRPGLKGWRESLMHRYQVGPHLVWAAQINHIAFPDWDLRGLLPPNSRHTSSPCCSIYSIPSSPNANPRGRRADPDCPLPPGRHFFSEEET